MPPPKQHSSPMSKSTKKHEHTLPSTTRDSRTNKRIEHATSPRKSVSSQTVVDRPSEMPAPHAEVDGVIIISAVGDVILDAEAEEGGEIVLLRVDSAVMRSASPYFDRLLDVKYKEGSTVVKELEEIRQAYASVAEAPISKLPHIKISYLGQTLVKTIRPLMTDFMNIVHDQDHTSRKLPLMNLANLAVVADRFDACRIVARWANEKNLLSNPISVKTASTTATSEEAVRQRLLVGLLLQHHSWFTASSAQIIMNGSSRWSDEEVQSSDGALWRDLPGSVEEELQFRHLLVLETIDSLVTYHLHLFTSKIRQCRLGYDTSPQCDSFQLGEFVKFLARYNLFHLHSTFSATPHDGDNGIHNIHTIIKTLRQCPSYQIDPHHSHCGPRNGLLHCLDFLQRYLTDSALGICLECWRDPAADHVWSRSRRPIRWCAGKAYGTRGIWPEKVQCGLRSQHDAARDMVLAEQRDWSSV